MLGRIAVILVFIAAAIGIILYVAGGDERPQYDWYSECVDAIPAGPGYAEELAMCNADFNR